MVFKYSIDHLDFSEMVSEFDLLNKLEEHEPDSFMYCVNTAHLNYAIAKEIGIEEDELLLYYKCGLFHDTGKLGMSYDFINYPGAYSIGMYTEMKKHTTGGGVILERINTHHYISETAKLHHCNFDGSGYPGGIEGKNIPFHARVTRITDSVDAYMSKRCYKEGGPAYGVMDDLKQYVGTSYDPELLEVFDTIHRKIMKVCHENGHDRPSQNMYMYQLKQLYPNDFEEKIFGKKISNT